MVPEVGPVSAKNLLSYLGSAEMVFRSSRGKLEKVPGIGPVLANSILSYRDFSKADEQIAFMEGIGGRVILYHEADYPQRLKRNADAPLLLYFKGKANLNHYRILSVVGTRQGSEEGRFFTEQCVKWLHSMNCLVVSGLAYGIDIHAHRAALAHQIGTIGVVAHGLDDLYPARHKKTVEEMYLNGGVLSEYPIRTRPDRENFPSRNRIVAGMSDATIVVETPLKGGAMITANLAHSYNRDVFAVPGKVGDPKKEGTHWPIKKNKAALLESAADLVEYLGWEKTAVAQQTQLALELTQAENRILEVLAEKEKWGIDELSLDPRISSSDISLNLLELELKGLLRSLPGKYYQKV